MAGLEDKQTIVCDYGSGMARAGFAGDDAPISVFPNFVGRPKEVVAGLDKEYYVGKEAQTKRALLSIQYPIEDNVVINWDDMEKIWHHTFYNALCVDPKEHPVLLTESPLNPRPNREKMTQIMFEKFGTPAMYLAVQPPLYLYSTGRTTGLVMDIGDGVSQAVPVYNGYINHVGMLRLDVTGHDLTEYLLELMFYRKITCPPERREQYQGMKDTLCYVALDYEQELMEKGDTLDTYRTYELPDGHHFIGPPRFKCPEALFQPSLAGKDAKGIHEVITKSILACDVDTRKELYENIMLTGGVTMFPGIVERMTKEITALAPTATKVNVVAPKDKGSAWIGGSILASLSSFEKIMITKDEYEEHGARVVNMKCF